MSRTAALESSEFDSLHVAKNTISSFKKRKKYFKSFKCISITNKFCKSSKNQLLVTPARDSLKEKLWYIRTKQFRYNESRSKRIYPFTGSQFYAIIKLKIIIKQLTYFSNTGKS